MLQDLRQLEEVHGQRQLVLRMVFKRGLHPFYPPTVQLVRPRCRAPLLGALSSHPMLQLAGWDPWRPQKDLIEQLRVFLQVRCLWPCHLLHGVSKAQSAKGVHQIARIPLIHCDSNARD